jgi:hypothetical protein
MRSQRIGWGDKVGDSLATPHSMTYIEVTYTGLEGDDWIYRHGDLKVCCWDTLQDSYKFKGVVPDEENL